MNASIQGCLNEINKSWRVFTHNDKSLTKSQVKAILEYGIRKGYTDTEQITEQEIDNILNAQ